MRTQTARNLLPALLAFVGVVVLPGEEPAQLGRKHWAFKPAVRPALPTVKNRSWPRNPIDQFVLAKLEAEKLTPSAEAERVTLIRRLTFDLTGLPPTPEEVGQFVSDKNSDAYERIVDRLLGSPRYGERWARHWLDVVHYGESHGYDKDKPRPNAWPYRDYVIRSLNHDTPYARFVEEQLAGDVLFPDHADGIVATGFIAAGPWDYVGHVELPESKTDGLIARYNDRDDMVMNAMSTFLSLTVHCARCHDHKFDPISQEEYYGLQAVFAGVDRADRPFDLDPAIAARRRILLADKRKLEARQKDLDAAAAQVTSPQIVELTARLKELKDQVAALPKADKESPSNGYHSGIEPAADVEKWVQVDLGQVMAINEVRLVPARPTDFPDTPGFGFPRRFRVEIAAEDNLRNTLADRTAADFPNPGDNPVVIPANDRSGRYIRVTATRLWERTQDYVFALAEIQVLSGTNNAALHARVAALDSIEAGRWGKEGLVDNFDSRKSLSEGSEPAHILAKRTKLKAETGTLEAERKNAIQSLLEPAIRAETEDLRDRLVRTAREIDSLPKPQLVYAAANEFNPSGSFVPSAVPRPIHLLKRGDVKQPGPLIAAKALKCVPGMDSQLEIADSQDEGSRRAALARWITDPRNLLTRRSIVNRVWQYHFGRGIVDTPNDFGHMGSPPTHPELLDWLACWFLDQGESLKKLHRLIVTSATYRQSSTPVAADVRRLTSKSAAGHKPGAGQIPSGTPFCPINVAFHLATERRIYAAAKNSVVRPHETGAAVNEVTFQTVSGSSAQRRARSGSHKESHDLLTSAAAAAQIDADNRFLWRMNRSRLDAESFRDTLLFLSGDLDLTMGGPSAQQFYFKDDHSPVYDYARFDVDSPAGSRFSIYRFIVRSAPDPFMEALDCPDANLLTPKRNVTLTALQALTTWNDPYVLKQCEHFAVRLQQESADLSKQIERACWLGLSRPPRPETAALLRAYAQQHGLANACRVLFNSSEFMFVE